MKNARLGELHTGITIAWKIINNLRYSEDARNGIKWRGTKEPLDEGGGEWKIRLKANY